METYDSQHQIYQDFQIAVKFRLKEQVPDHVYVKFFKVLRSHHRWTIDEFSLEVKHLNRHYGSSVGLFAEVPVIAGDNIEAGVKFILLEHESGPEFFMALDPAVQTAGAFAASYAAGKLLDLLISPAMSAIKDAMKNRWPGFMVMHKNPIKYVEIRTLEKGRMRIKFDDFNPTQLTCLVRGFSDLEHISESNEKCFGGKLFSAQDD